MMMMNDMMLIVAVLGILIFVFGMLIGLIIGQCNIWRYLRKKRTVIIDNWKYTGEQMSVEEMYARALSKKEK